MTTTTSPATPRPRRDQRGSFTFAVIFWALVTVMLAGLVVDGGLSITERQRAGDLAEQAAREAANDLNPDELRQGRYQLVSIDDACRQADRVVSASGLDPGTVVTSCTLSNTLTLPGGQVVPEVTVQITIQYSPILIGMIYSGSFIARASASAHPQPGI